MGLSAFVGGGIVEREQIKGQNLQSLVDKTYNSPQTVSERAFLRVRLNCQYLMRFLVIVKLNLLVEVRMLLSKEQTKSTIINNCIIRLSMVW